MDEKTKLYVFTKKEVALIFLFLVMIAATSFIFGIKIGKNYSYESAGLTPADRIRIEDMRSEEEEDVEKIARSYEESEQNDAKVSDDSNEKLEQYIGRDAQGKGPIQKKTQKIEIKKKAPVKMDKAPVAVEKAEMTKVNQGALDLRNMPDPMAEKRNLPKTKRDGYRGKHSIQLSSHRSLEDAQAFAEGFRARGYDPIITETEIPNRGTWYRVSVGKFDSKPEAINYVKGDPTLFQGQDYFFIKFE
jgi:cell division septation protein DedD